MTTDTTKLRELIAGIVFPLTLTETPDYAEVYDSDDAKVALTIKPKLFAAVNGLPDILDELEALRERVREAEELARLVDMLLPTTDCAAKARAFMEPRR